MLIKIRNAFYTFLAFLQIVAFLQKFNGGHSEDLFKVFVVLHGEHLHLVEKLHKFS